MDTYSLLIKIYLPISFISNELKGKAVIGQIAGTVFDYVLEKATGFIFNTMQFEHKSTCIRMSIPHKFTGTIQDFQHWAETKGRSEIIDLSYVAQNIVIDAVKVSFCKNQLFDALRYFGPSDWVYLDISVENKNVICQMNRFYFTAIPPSEAINDLGIHSPLSSAGRMLLRSSTLINSGYPTEGFLIAFATLDSTIQDSIIHGMRLRGLNEKDAKSHLRTILTKRAETYLTSLYQIIFGRSLLFDNNDLLKSIKKINHQRNDAIHSGIEISRAEAQDAIGVILKAMKYLADSSGKSIALPERIGI
jgi:hypothetical protein